MRGPADVQRMNYEQLTGLAAEIRDFLVEKVSQAGGHLGPNLGIVELTLALHRVFDSPREPLLFDVGHQAYVHKIVTGRQTSFDGLRQLGGLSGYPSRAENDHDFMENSHASTALSYADGMAKAFQLIGQTRHVVAVVGDGALTGGMCWEALNNIAADPSRPVVIVVNDNGRSYAPTFGGLADRLAALRMRPGYERALHGVRRAFLAVPWVGRLLYGVLHAVKRGFKDALSPQPLFEDLGLKYLGPVDGHDLPTLEAALRRARAFGGPVLVHVVTCKGHGYGPAENDAADRMHQISPPAVTVPRQAEIPRPKWTNVFSDELVRIGSERDEVVAITAAMRGSTGLDAFAAAYPRRCYDVGIAEQHAMTSAAGMAAAGLHPVVAIYSTFLNRAFDQLLMDVALHRAPVTVVLDRAGVTGPDGASHHGMWDLALLGMVPGIRVAAPRDEPTLREELREALADSSGPTALRFSRGTVASPIKPLCRVGTVDVLRKEGQRNEVLLVGVGAFAELAMATADRLADQEIGVTVVDPRWIFPVPHVLAGMAAEHDLVCTIEDAGRHGGFGSAFATVLRDRVVRSPLLDFALPQRFLEHGSRSQLLTLTRLTAQDIASRITEKVAEHRREAEQAEPGLRAPLVCTEHTREGEVECQPSGGPTQEVARWT
ncbi:1-deoxy-D-xylulose-5-phosphate synthase [Amycolatopsis samaneae]